MKHLGSSHHRLKKILNLYYAVMIFCSICLCLLMLRADLYERNLIIIHLYWLVVLKEGKKT